MAGLDLLGHPREGTRTAVPGLGKRGELLALRGRAHGRGVGASGEAGVMVGFSPAVLPVDKTWASRLPSR